MSSAQKSPFGNPAWFMAAVGLAAVAGYGWGSMSDDRASDAGKDVSAPTKVRERTLEEGKASPATAHEFVRVVGDGSLDEREYWRHVRSFTEQEVKTALKGLETLRMRNMLQRDLAVMLFYRWGELDPVAANATAKAMYPKQFDRCREAVIAAWINQGGGVAAWEAVREEGAMWDCTRSVPGAVSEMLISSLSDRDDLTAFKEVLRLKDENCGIAERLCEARAVRAARTPESRAAFLAAADLHPSAYVRYSCARDELLEAWSELEPEAAEAASLIWEKEGDVARAEEAAREEAMWREEKEKASHDE